MDQYSKLHMTKAFLLHRYYHKQARNLDTFCKVNHFSNKIDKITYKIKFTVVLFKST